MESNVNFVNISCVLFFFSFGSVLRNTEIIARI